MNKTRFRFPLLLIGAIFVIGCSNSQTTVYYGLPELALTREKVEVYPFSFDLGITEVSDDLAYETDTHYANNKRITDLYVHYDGSVTKRKLADLMEGTSSALQDDDGFWLAYEAWDRTLVTYIELPLAIQTISTDLTDNGSVKLYRYGDTPVAVTYSNEVISLFTLDATGKATLADFLTITFDDSYSANSETRWQSAQIGATLYMNYAGLLFSYDGVSLSYLDEGHILGFVPHATALSYWKETVSKKGDYVISRCSSGEEPVVMSEMEGRMFDSGRMAYRSYVTESGLYIICGIGSYFSLNNPVYIIKASSSASKAEAYQTGNSEREVFRYGGYLYQAGEVHYRYAIS